jgi:hypothetical protein
MGVCPVSNRSIKRVITNAVLLSIAISAVVWLTGCGGGETAGYNVPANNSNVIYFTPVLRVADASGVYPFQDAEVWVEEEPGSPRYTGSRFLLLGEGYPPEFQDHEANWISDIYSVPRPRHLETTTIHVRVYAAGFVTGETTFVIKSDDPNRLFGYDRLDMNLAAVVNPQGATAAPPVVTHQGTVAAGPPVPPGAKIIPLPQH